MDADGRVWQPCRQDGRPCEDCKRPIALGAPVYLGFVASLFWCADCTKRRIRKDPPDDYAKAWPPPKMAKAGLGMERLAAIGLAVIEGRDWAKAAAKDGDA